MHPTCSYKKDNEIKQDSIIPKCQSAHPQFYFNNLGVIHLKMKKYALAAIYFGKALKLMQKNDQAGVQGVNPIDSTTSHSSLKIGEVCYNYGIALLKCKKYQEAFQCFNRASSLMRNMPRIWYHMALCCLNKQREDSIKAGASLSETDLCYQFKGFEQAGFEKNGGGSTAAFKRILLSASQQEIEKATQN